MNEVVSPWVRGLVGWVTLGAATALLGACDDPRQNCRDVAQKYEVCAPQIIEETMAGLPESFRLAIDGARQAQTQKINETAAKLKAQCESTTLSEADERQFRAWRACVKKPCAELTRCIRGE